MTPYKLSLWLRIAKLTPSHPLAWRIEWLRDRREGTGGSHKSAPRRGGSGRVPLRRRRPQGRKRRAGDCITVLEAGREPGELGEEPPSRGAEHAAPACSARVHPAQRGGDRAEAVAPGRCLGPDRLHVSPARSHVHRLSPVRRPDVLRINKMKLRATGGQTGPGPLNPHPRQNDLPTTAVSRRSPSARPEPAGQVAALARPRPPAPPHRPGGALPQSLIKKVAKLTLPKVVVACAPLSLPAMGAALDYAPRRGPAREGCSRNPELLGPARAGGGRASIRGRSEGGGRACGVPGPAPLLGTVSPLDLSPCR
ncbi:uncharacterized protein LOC114209405 [Eumetopias jubatus]|uniref:uncharacterized protein LOC114209405 n=1 Tax=Eumetopias jubatus TaxID=34886 RepID=UPI001015E547|nr:uncharacterized protein LOC114209405 [Eumetopias jubatus]